MPLDYTPYRNHEVPIRHWNAKVAPMAGIAARGVVWYQGEQESGYGSGNPKAVEAFGDLYENMVGAWREKWGDKSYGFVRRTSVVWRRKIVGASKEQTNFGFEKTEIFRNCKYH